MFLPQQRLLRQEAAAVSPTVVLSKPVFTWGWGLSGVLGLGDTLSRSSPTQIGSSSWIMLAAGQNNTLGVLSTGALFTWGSAANGQLGNGTTVGDRSSPIAIGTSSWNYVEAGSFSNYAIRTDGGLFFWGQGSSGRTGLNDNTNRNSPVQIGASSWIQVSSKNLNTAAITTDNLLFVWGFASYLGLGSTNVAARSSPVQLTTNFMSLFTQVSVGESGTLAIGLDGIGWQWGGVGPNSNLVPNPPGGGAYATPYKLMNLNTQRPTVLSTFQSETDESTYLSLAGKTGLSWRDAAVNPGGGIGLRSDNKIFVWGTNMDGIMGMGTSLTGDNVYAPQPLLPQSNFNFIAAGGDQGLRPRFHAIGTDGILYSWGNNFAGTLGVGDTIRRTVPTAVNIASSFVFVAGGPFCTAAISTTGGLFTWGQGTNGALGNGTTTGNVLNPTQIGSSSWYMVKVGHNYMNGITGTYKLFSWGLGTGGQIGDGTANTRSVPTAVGNSSWIFVSAGSSFALAIRSDSTLWAWGTNEVGQLGIGDTITRSSPVQIASPANWRWVDACNRSTAGPLFSTAQRAYGIASDNTLYAWGFLTSGTGLSIAGSRSAPVQISASQYSNVNCGLSYNVAVRTNGVQYYWGSPDPGNSMGGNPLYAGNQNIAFSTLQHVQSNWESWRMVRAGVSHGAAIRSDYKLFVWGRDDRGQLGLNLPVGTVYSYPVQVGSSSWTQVSVGQNTTYAIDTRGRLFSWGAGDEGQNGNNSILSTSSPVQIGTSSFTMISANRSHAVALRV